MNIANNRNPYSVLPDMQTDTNCPVYHHALACVSEKLLYEAKSTD